ncbi:MAG: hypothetical protein IJK23_03530, partial [Clostridia bacterium]|nr:hypothetical protein [Clostridia bacterium]
GGQDPPIDGVVGVARRINCIFYNGFNLFAFLAGPQGSGLNTQAGGQARPYKLSPNAAGNIPINQNLSKRRLIEFPARAALSFRRGWLGSK